MVSQALVHLQICRPVRAYAHCMEECSKECLWASQGVVFDADTWNGAVINECTATATVTEQTER